MSVWAVYARVSTEEQAKFGASLSSQVEAARQRAMELGASDVVEFVDHGVPGDVLTRPGLSKLRDAASTRVITGLVVYDPDRLARNLSHQLLLTEEFQSAGVRLEFVNFEWKDTDEGRLFYSIRGAISEYEKAKIRERTTRGKWAKVKQGQSPNGRVPYGYVFDKPTKTIKINEETAPFARMIFDWIVREGLGTRRIAAKLTAMNVPPPMRAQGWATCSVRHIVNNPAYMGQQIVHRYDTEGTHKNPHVPKEQRKAARERPPEEWITIPIPRLIDEKTWYLVQDAMRDMRRKYAGRRGQHHFLLARVAACGICGMSVYGMHIPRPNKSPTRYYRCTSTVSERVQSCRLPYHHADKVEPLVWSLVKEWATHPARHYEAVSRAHQETSPKAVGPDVRHLETQRADVDKELSQLTALVGRGLVKLEHVSAAIRDLSQRSEELQQMLDDIAREQALGPRWTPTEIAPVSGEDLENFSPEKKQETVRRYIERVVLYPDGKVKVVPKINPLWSD